MYEVWSSQGESMIAWWILVVLFAAALLLGGIIGDHLERRNERD